MFLRRVSRSNTDPISTSDMLWVTLSEEGMLDSSRAGSPRLPSISLLTSSERNLNGQCVNSLEQVLLL